MSLISKLTTNLANLTGKVRLFVRILLVIVNIDSTKFVLLVRVQVRLLSFNLT